MASSSATSDDILDDGADDAPPPVTPELEVVVGAGALSPRGGSALSCQ